METFTQMRNRLMEVHGWCKRVATIATRYYMGIENYNDLNNRISDPPRGRHPTLSLREAHEIAKWR